jgi:hypothetical protein
MNIASRFSGMAYQWTDVATSGEMNTPTPDSMPGLRQLSLGRSARSRREQYEYHPYCGLYVDEASLYSVLGLPRPGLSSSNILSFLLLCDIGQLDSWNMDNYSSRLMSEILDRHAEAPLQVEMIRYFFASSET